MALVLTETKTPTFAEGWKSVEISKCKTGDYNGTRFYDLWFQGLPDTLNCRVWESRNKYGEEFSIANLIRYSNPDIIEEMDGNDGKAVIKVDDSPNSLVGKKLQVYIFKNAEGYSRISQKVVPDAPFKNPVNNVTEETIKALKSSTERWESSKKTNAAPVANGKVEDQIPF